jgi:signal transduction histidine kinase
MRWINSFPFSPARRAEWSFLFFLYLTPCWFITFTGEAQTSDKLPNQDSINYYLQIIDEGEKQVGRALASIGYLYQKAGRYNSAIGYFDRALPLLNGEGRSTASAKIHQTKGTIYEIFGDNADPVRYYRLARVSYLNAARIIETDGSHSQQMSINQNLADIATKRRNFNRAVIYQNKVIKMLTRLYQDSIQSQAESFNDLLKKEIESSKDTIYLEVPVASENADRILPLINWRHVLIFLLTIGLFITLIGWLAQYRKASSLQKDVEINRTAQKQLVKQKEELQKLNLTLTKTEKEQRRSNMNKDKLFSIISHDLRSPINTVSGFLNILAAKLSSIGDIELRSLAKEMIDSTDRLSHFLDDLLRWSMSQLGQVKPNVEKINLKKLVEENYLLVKSRLKAKNIHFKANVPENIDLYADTNMLQLILRNIISNSIKFCRKDGYIAINLKPGETGFSLVEIADDGIGMSEEKLQSLFEFKGSEINGGSNNEGAGLGLLLCKEFAELNGGNIEVSSKLGEGTRFIIHLPDHPPETPNGPRLGGGRD